MSHSEPPGSPMTLPRRLRLAQAVGDDEARAAVRAPASQRPARAFLRLGGVAAEAPGPPTTNSETARRARPSGQERRGTTARLLAAASHDLRQPLQAIGLWVELLRERAGDAELGAILAKIQTTAHAAERVLDALLDITRLDMGVVGVHAIDFAVADLLDHVAITFAPMAREHGLELRVHASCAMAHSDPVLLERILFNFVGNAIRYCARGGVLIGCRRRAGVLSLEVWDTGPGISGADLGHVFEEFHQLTPEGTHRARGAIGLGLSIAQRTAALLGHAIQVTSWLGRGSRFAVEVPEGTRPPCLAATPGAQAALSVLQGAFVVVVEDEQEQREAVELLLRNWGCHVVAAATAGEAVASLQGHLRQPSALLVDYRLLPPHTGADAIRVLRAALGADIPAVLVSGECASTLQASLRELGATMLPKPVHADVLRQHLADAVLSGRCRPG